MSVQSSNASCPPAYGGGGSGCTSSNGCGRSTNFRLCNVTQKNYMASNNTNNPKLSCPNGQCTDSNEVCGSGYVCVVYSGALYGSGAPNINTPNYNNPLTLPSSNKIVCANANQVYTTQSTSPSGGRDGPCPPTA